MRVALVNDLVLARAALRRLVTGPGGCEIAWEASDGEEALARCREDRPDLVLMDLMMPRMDGVEATRRIMAEAPCPIVIVTATVEGHYARVYDALGAGALDAVDTPRLGTDGRIEDEEPLLRRIHVVRRLGEGARPGPAPPATAPAATPASAGPRGALPILAVAASTGGPDALVRLLRGLPAACRVPVVVVQHLGATFLDGFVQWLASQTGRKVSAVGPGRPVRPEPETVLVAAGREHLVALPSGEVGLLAAGPEALYRPSADVLFSSLLAWPRPGAAAVLTGMGRDGAEGLGRLRAAGWATFAQDRETSVVFGMPRAAAEAKAAITICAIDAMGEAIARALARLEATPPGGVPA